MNTTLFVWSIPLKSLPMPMGVSGSEALTVVRMAINVQPYLSRVFRLPVHTFCTLNDNWTTPPDSENSGYWYCAGDFCQTNIDPISGVSLDSFDKDYAQCLVKPNIQLSHPRHQVKVIGGSYLLDFVCHNIVNRILFACSPTKTLVDTDLPLVGYKAIVNSPLQVYGRNKLEWINRVSACSLISSSAGGAGVSPFASSETGADFEDSVELSLRSQETELRKIHVRALGNEDDAEKISIILNPIDELYRGTSAALYKGWLEGKINTLILNEQMEKLLITTIRETEVLIGRGATEAIYGEYFLFEAEHEIQIDEKSNRPKYFNEELKEIEKNGDSEFQQELEALKAARQKGFTEGEA